jgi:hypothetical protein
MSIGELWTMIVVSGEAEKYAYNNGRDELLRIHQLF